MFRIEKFLTIFELETGGLFIGYFSLIICTLILIISIFALTKVFTNWEEVEEIFHNTQLKKDLDHDPATVELFKHTFIATLVSFILLQIILLMTFTLLVRGVRTRNPRQINPSVLLFCISTTLGVIGLIDRRSPQSIIIFVFHFYVLVVLFSLKKKFQDEQQQGRGHFIIHQSQFIPVTVQQQKA